MSRMVARAMLHDDVIVARLTELLKSLRKLPSYAQQLARQVTCCLACISSMRKAVMSWGNGQRNAAHKQPASLCSDIYRSYHS